MAKKSKADKIWAYKIKHPQATTSEIAKATKSSYNYVHALMSKIGTPKEVFEKEAKKVTRGASVRHSQGVRHQRSCG